MIFDIKIRKAAVCVMLAAVLSVCSGCGDKGDSKDDRADSISSEIQSTSDDTNNTSDTLSDDKDDRNDGIDDQNGTSENGQNNTTEAANDGGGQGDLSDDGLKEMTHYTKTIDSENGRLKVEADSPVKLRVSDKYPVVDISTTAIDDELLNKVKDVLIGDTKLYDGIRMYDPEFDDYSGDKVILSGEDQDLIKGKVPRSEITAYPVDTKLFTVSDKAEQYKEIPDYTGYYMQLMPEGELFYGVSDGKDGIYTSFSAVNSKVYGDSLKYFRSSEYGITDGLVLPGINVSLCWPVASGIDSIADPENPERALYPPMVEGELQGDDGLRDWVDDPKFTNYEFRESAKETNSVTKEEALKQAEELLKKLGIDDIYMAVSAEEMYISDHSTITRKTNADGTYSAELTVGKVWDIVYLPAVNGNIVQDYGEMIQYGSDGRKSSVWFNSNIEVMINDNGIVGFSYACPIKYDRVGEENADLMPFEEILEVYEKNILDVLNTTDPFYGIMDNDDTEDKVGFTIKIDDITLRYARMSDHESNDRGYLVPIWDFSGTAYDAGGKVLASGSFIQINAIDGSVYNSIEGR